jgi:hypothetical protein
MTFVFIGTSVVVTGLLQHLPTFTNIISKVDKTIISFALSKCAVIRIGKEYGTTSISIRDLESMYQRHV